jgi:hypothetical protein
VGGDPEAKVWGPEVAGCWSKQRPERLRLFRPKLCWMRVESRVIGVRVRVASW